MDFLTWWFDGHWVIALLLTPFGSTLWAMYQEYSAVWIALCFTIWGLWEFLTFLSKRW